jgi:glycosyltransferase involved in cell wall biosynthesis
MKVVALIEVFNEERYLPTCLRFLRDHGISAYIVDNDSTDRTLEIATSHLGQDVIGIEKAARNGVFSLYPQLKRKERLAASLDADWFIHMDADEIRLPPPAYRTLSEALAEVDSLGFNAVQFMEFVFVPTLENPDHDHADYVETMRWYYPFRPHAFHRLNAWKRQSAPVELAESGGHHVQFPGRRVYPERFVLKHYLYLSQAHALEKYAGRQVDPEELSWGWQTRRTQVNESTIALPPRKTLRLFVSDEELYDASPRTGHYIFEPWSASAPEISGGSSTAPRQT